MKKYNKNRIIKIDEISKKTKYSPIIVYDILKELEREGLVTSNGRNKG